MQAFLKFMVFAGLVVTLASPAMADEGQFVSTMLGMGVGGALGSTIGHGEGRLAATGAGIFVGGVIGNELGRPSYRGYSGGYGRPAAAYYEYPYDMFPSSGSASYQPNYVAPPAPPPPPPVTYLDTDTGDYCREVSQQVRIGNQVQESYGTACLQPDGSWHIVQ